MQYNVTSYEVLTNPDRCTLFLVEKDGDNMHIPPYTIWSDNHALCYGAGEYYPAFAFEEREFADTESVKPFCQTGGGHSDTFYYLTVVDIDVAFYNMRFDDPASNLVPKVGELVFGSKVELDNRKGTQLQEKQEAFTKTITETSSFTTEQSVSYASTVRVGSKLGVSSSLSDVARMALKLLTIEGPQLFTVSYVENAESSSSISGTYKYSKTITKSESRMISETVVVRAGPGEHVRALNFVLLESNAKLRVNGDAVVASRALPGKQIEAFMRDQGFWGWIQEKSNNSIKYTMRGSYVANQFARVVTEIELLNSKPNTTLCGLR